MKIQTGWNKTTQFRIPLLFVLAAMLLAACTSAARVAPPTISTATAVSPMGAPPAGAPPVGAPGDNSVNGAPPGGGTAGASIDTALASVTGAYILNGETATQKDQTYLATNADQSAVYVINDAKLTLINPTVTKTGDTSSSEYSSFYGLNAEILATSAGTVIISGGTIKTSGAGANGVFATGDGTSITLSDATVTAEGDGAHAVMATLGGKLFLTNVNMTTTNSHSGAIATDRGGGTIQVIGGVVTTSGQDSPGIYSTGEIIVTGAKISSSGSEAAVIEGANSITLTDTDLSSSFAGKWGVMIYQSMSGDAQGTEGTFSMTGGSLADSATDSPLFFVTNSTAKITLKGVNLSAASEILVNAGGTTRWGNSGANGGIVILTADKQILTGNMMADTISILTAALQNGASLTGAINPDHSAKAANLTLDSFSTWTVTADSYLTSLADSSGISGSAATNIIGNGHTVYYVPSTCPDLGGKTYTLSNRGYLKPIT